MNKLLFALVILAPLHVTAGVDKPWQDDSLGGGTLSGASLLFGTIGAGFLVYEGLKTSSSIGQLLLSAVLGFSFGAILGMPVGCMLK